MMRPRDVAPATGDDAPVRATKVAITQRVADRVDRAIDVTQPVTYRQQNQTKLPSNPRQDHQRVFAFSYACSLPVT